jgi:hypothetical protein
MGNSVNKIESSLTSTIEDSLYEIILSNLISELTRLLDAKLSSDNDVRQKQKMLVKILLDAKNECVRDAKNQIVSIYEKNNGFLLLKTKCNILLQYTFENEFTGRPRI